MITLRAELHLHTVLSPCAEVEMIPPLIVQEALNRGIQCIAVTDHNACANVGAVQKAAEGTGLTVLPGMEVQTREEVHSLCLFDTLEQVQEFQAWLSSRLPVVQNRPDYFGEQFVVDETGDFIRREEQLLLVSAACTLEETCQKASSLGGLFIPAHVNRTNAGLIAVLGFIPPDLPLVALEISRHLSPVEAAKKFPQIRKYPLIQSGDVHRLDEYLGVNTFSIEAPTIDEIRQALQGENGRSHRILQG